MRREIFPVSASRSFSLDWRARGVIVNNPTGNFLYLRMGGTDAPTVSNADYIVSPYQVLSSPAPACNQFAIAVGAAAMQSSPDASAQITFLDQEIAYGITQLSLPGYGFQPIENITQPGLTYQISTIWAQPNLLTAVDAILLTPPAGKRIAIFGIELEYGITAILRELYFFRTTSIPFTNVFLILPVGTMAATMGASDARSSKQYAPPGKQLPIGAPLGAVQYGANTNQINIEIDYCFL